MPRVVILAYWYPPLHAIGSQRPAKLARYLPSFGWTPTVITVEPECRRFLEPPLEIEPLEAGIVHRTRDRSWHTWLARRTGQGSAADLERFAFDNVRASGGVGLRALHFIYQQLVSFPDEAWPWLIDYRTIERLVRQADAQAIVSTSPPATTHLLAARLSRRLGLPWIADLRDPWTQRPTRRRMAPLRAVERWLERRTLAQATRLVTVSDEIAQDLGRLHRNPTVVLPNGFDPDDERVDRGPALPLARDRFTFVFTGTLEHETREPGMLLDALDALIKAGELSAADLEFWLIGRNLGVARPALAAHPTLAASVRLEPPIARGAALATQRAATVLVVLGPTEALHGGALTGKVFEYLGARRPILAFGARGGALDRLLAETGGGVLVTSAAEARDALLHWARERRETGRVAWRGDPAAVARYDRRALAGRWAALLDEVTRRAPVRDARSEPGPLAEMSERAETS
jgi:glycosyltransferase involved in cell wall biosynthesis